MTRHTFLELGGAALITERETHGAQVRTLVSDCRCLNGDFVAHLRSSRTLEFDSPEALLDYAFVNPNVECSLHWSCSEGLVILEFGAGGELVIAWTDQHVTLDRATEVIQRITAVAGAERGYVSLGGWLPGTLGEFEVGFNGDTLFQVERE